MNTRLGLVLILFSLALLLSCPAYARNDQIVSDDEYVKAYYNLYKDYLTAEDANKTRDELLDVVDYYLSAPDVSTDLSVVGSRSHQMIGRILVENGVVFDCGKCNSTFLGDRCCIYRVGRVPVVYECIGSEVSGVSNYSWKQLWQCVYGCCKDGCCLGSNQSTTTIPTSTTTTRSTTTTTLSGDNCVDDGYCYAKYGPCWICLTIGGNCTYRVICDNAQDCKDRYNSTVDWTCVYGCCIPPLTTSTTSPTTSSTTTSSTTSTTTTTSITTSTTLTTTTTAASSTSTTTTSSTPSTSEATTSSTSSTTPTTTTTSTTPSTTLISSDICRSCCAPGVSSCDVVCQDGRTSISGSPAISACEYDGSTLTIRRGTSTHTQTCLNARCAGGVTTSTAGSTTTSTAGGSCFLDGTPVGQCSSTVSWLRCVSDPNFPIPYLKYDPTCV